MESEIGTELDGRKNVEALIEDLTSLDISVRDDAQMKLIALDSLAVEPLITAMSGHRRRVSWEAAAILSQIDDPRWIMPMLEAVTSNNPILGQVAVQALERFGTEFVQPLIAQLPGCHIMVQLHIVAMLGRLGERRGVTPLMTLLKSADSPSLRCEIIQALGFIGDPQALELIQSFQGDHDHHVRKRVRIAAGRLNERSQTAADIHTTDIIERGR